MRSAVVRIGRQALAPAAQPPDAVALLASLEAQAQAAGHARGLSEGRAEGLEEGRREGHAQGLAEGRAQARHEAREQAARAAQTEALARREAQAQWAAAAQRLQALAHEAAQGCAQELQLLCVELLTRLLGETLAEPAAIRARLQRLLAQLPPRQPVTVRVHPHWLTASEPVRDPDLACGVTDLASLDGGVPLRFVPDASLALADIVLDLSMGSLDARLDRLWEQLRHALQPVDGPASAGPFGPGLAQEAT